MSPCFHKGQVMSRLITAGLILGCLLAASCQTPKAKEAFVCYQSIPAQEATLAEVKDCRYLGEVKAQAPTSKSGTPVLAQRVAKMELLKKAGNMGASHVVPVKTLGNRRPKVFGKAYLCSK